VFVLSQTVQHHNLHVTIASEK